MSTDDQINKLGKFILENFDEEITEGGAVDVAMKSMEHWRNVAFDLWRVLDNIDTLDDACKDNDSEFRKHAIIQATKRHGILLLEGPIEERYDQYLKKVYE